MLLVTGLVDCEASLSSTLTPDLIIAGSAIAQAGDLFVAQLFTGN